jgi:glycosyltransferase involved in cell wall biosynthesis
MPQVSVVIPSYNAARFLPLAIESILTQSVPPHEVIIVDDGSTDDTSAVLAALDAASVRVIHQPNRGPAAARNTGIAAATGDLVALLDADDIALPQRLAIQIAALGKDPDLALVSSGYEWIDEAGQQLPWPYHSWRHYPDLNQLRTWLFDCPIVPSATMLRRSAWSSVGGFSEHLIGPEDWEFWMRLALSGQRMAWNPEVLCHYRRVSASVSGSAYRMAEHSIMALEGIVARPDFPANLVPVAAQALALRHADAAKRLFWTGAWKDGQVALHTALQHDSGLLSGYPCRLEDELVVAAMDPFVADPITFLGTALDHLPAEAAALAARRGPVLLRCRGELLVRGLARRNPAAWRHLTALRLHPAWLLDRGLWGGLWRAVTKRRKLTQQGRNLEDVA